MCLSVDLDETNRILNCHARIQEFSPEGGGGGGCPGHWQQPFFSPQLILQKANG